jgi:hypothetical protein
MYLPINPFVLLLLVKCLQERKERYFNIYQMRLSDINN